MTMDKLKELKAKLLEARATVIGIRAKRDAYAAEAMRLGPLLSKAIDAAQDYEKLVKECEAAQEQRPTA